MQDSKSQLPLLRVKILPVPKNSSEKFVEDTIPIPTQSKSEQRRIKNSGWIGVDLDGTLTKWERGSDIWSIGEPIPKMIERVKKWLADGRQVKIVTARVAGTERTNPDGVVDTIEFANKQRSMIMKWCMVVFGEVIPVTAEKDFEMIELWDDRCVQLIPNTGERVDGK